MREPQGERHGQGCGGIAFAALESPERPGRSCRRRGHERDEERQADDTEAGERLQGNAVRLRHRRGGLAIALPRYLECVGAGTDERVGLEDVPGLAPPLEAVVRAEATEAIGAVGDLAAAELVG